MDDVLPIQLLCIALLLMLSGLIVAFTRRAWAERTTHPWMEIPPKMWERFYLFVGIFLCIMGLLILVSVVFPTEPPPRMEESAAEAPSCTESLLNTIGGLGLGLFFVASRRRSVEKAGQYVTNPEFMVKLGLILGMVFILFGAFFAYDYHSSCLRGPGLGF